MADDGDELGRGLLQDFREQGGATTEVFALKESEAGLFTNSAEQSDENDRSFKAGSSSSFSSSTVSVSSGVRDLYTEGMKWPAATFLMTASLIGIGVMGLPRAMSRLGWSFGLFLLIFIGGGCCYSGLVISRIVLHITKTDGRPRKYGDIGMAAYGTRGERFVRWSQMVYLAGVVVAFQHVASTCLQQVVIALDGTLCLGEANVFVSLMMLPVMQLQTLEKVTLIALLGVLMIIISIALFLRELIYERNINPNHTNELSSFENVVGAAMTIAFAYQGQSIFPEIQSEMLVPEDMPKSVIGSACTMAFLYIFVGLLGYQYLGDGAAYLELWSDKYFEHSSRTTVANICLFVHVLTAFTINGNVLNQACCEWIAGPPQQLAESLGGGVVPHGRFTWLCVTSSTGLAIFLLSNIVPNIGLLIPLVGATCGNALTFLAPYAILLKLVDLTERERQVHIGLLVLATLVTLVCTYQTFATMAAGIAAAPAPFSC